MTRVSLDVTSDQEAMVKELAEKTGVSKAEIRRRAFEAGLNALQGAGEQDLSEDISSLQKSVRSLQGEISALRRCCVDTQVSANGSLGMLSWFMPHFCRSLKKDDGFLSYVSKTSPSKTFETGREMGRGLSCKGAIFPGVLGTLPRSVGLNTDEMVGMSRKDWEALCKRNEQEAAGNGKVG